MTGISQSRAPDHGGEQGFQFAALLPAALLAAIGLIGLVALTLSREAIEGQFLVIGRPSLGRDAVTNLVLQAGGGVIAFGGLPNVAIAASQSDQFLPMARANGAWLAIPAPAIFGCLTGGGSGEGIAQ